MAIINKAGIGEGGLIQAEHITRIIDSLNETGSYTVVATGSFTGSFTGNGSGLTGVTAGSSATASYVTSSAVDGPYGFDSILTASFAVTASHIDTASFANTASFATTASFASTASYVNTLTQNVSITGTLQTSGSLIRRYRIMTITDGDISTSGVQSIASGDDIVLVIDQTTASPSPTQATIDLTAFLQSTAGRCVEIARIQTTGTGDGIVVTAGTMAGQALMLNNTSESNGNRAICSAVGNSVTLMSQGTALTGSIWGNGY